MSKNTGDDPSPSESIDAKAFGVLIRAAVALNAGKER